MGPVLRRRNPSATADGSDNLRYPTSTLTTCCPVAPSGNGCLGPSVCTAPSPATPRSRTSYTPGLGVQAYRQKAHASVEGLLNKSAACQAAPLIEISTPFTPLRPPRA